MNYSKVGVALAQSGDLFGRSDAQSGLILVGRDGSPSFITCAADLAPVVADRIALTVYLGDKVKGSKLTTCHMNAMLRTEAFLSQFQVVDHVSAVASYREDFSLAEPGFNEGSEGFRCFYTGRRARILDSMDRINAFLDAMDFESGADRANALAAALTVMLRNHWPGGKPIILATASKSHAGKDTVILFASGETQQCSISYQAANWAVERNIVDALHYNPDAGVLVIENARLDGRDSVIASAFVERIATDPKPFLSATGSGSRQRR